MSKSKTVKVQKQVLDIDPKRIEEYRESFKLFDKDNNGLLTVDEIYKIMKNFGNPISKDTIKDMIKKIDSSGDGMIDFDEFISLMKIVEEEMPEEEEEEDENLEDPIIEAFKTFDKKDSGKISIEEFKYIMTQIGDVFSGAEWDLLCKESEFDDSTKEIDYRKFVKSWREK